MPRYTKEADATIFKKRFRNLSHKAAAGVHANLSQSKFRLLQELSMHGLGYPTDFSQSLSVRPKKKVKPSSFKIYAGAQNTQEIVHALTQEKINHDDPQSETHLGGGILDAFNAMGRWAFGLHGTDTNPQAPDMNWTYDDLDANNVPDHIQERVDALFNQMDDTPAPATPAPDAPQNDDDSGFADKLVPTVTGAVGGYAAKEATAALEEFAGGAAENVATWIMDILAGALMV